MNEKKIYIPVTMNENDNDGKKAYARVIFTFVYMYRLYRKGTIDKNHVCYVNALYNLASVITASVLKKIYDSSCNETIEKYRRENDIAVLANTKYCIENSTDTYYNKNGRLITDIVDKDLYDGIHENINKGLSERSVMVENVVYDIINYCKDIPDNIIFSDEKYRPVDENGDRLTDENGKKLVFDVNFLTRPITAKRLNRHIYVSEVLTSAKNNDKVIVKEKSSLLQLFHKRLRRYIDNNDTKCEVNHKYTYLDKVYTDENGDSYMYYERYLGYNQFKFNVNDSYSSGHKKLSCDDKALYDFNELVKLLNLTDIQKRVLECRLKNGGQYGVKSISTMTGVPVNSVKSALRVIRDKAIKCKIIPMTENYITNDDTEIKTGLDLEKMNDVNIGIYAIEKAYSDGGRIAKREKGKMFKINKSFKPADISTLIRINYRKKKGYNSKCKDISNFKATCKPIVKRSYNEFSLYTYEFNKLIDTWDKGITERATKTN